MRDALLVQLAQPVSLTDLMTQPEKWMEEFRERRAKRPRQLRRVKRAMKI